MRIWVPFSYNPRALKVKSGGAICNSSKEQGSPLSYQIMGHKSPVYTAYVHRERKGSNPNANQSISKDKAAGAWKFTIHIHSVLRIWMSADSLHTSTSFWGGQKHV